MVSCFPGKKTFHPLTPNPSPPRGEGSKRAPLPSGERGWGEGFKIHTMARVPLRWGRHPLAFRAVGLVATKGQNQEGSRRETGAFPGSGAATDGRHLDLDVDTRRQGQALVEGLDRLAGRLE